MFEQSESTGALLAVERERVVAAALVDPERLVEAPLAARRPRARAARRARGRATPRARSRPCAASRRRRSPAPRTARSAARAMRPSGKRCESHESFHDWFVEPARRSAARTRRSRRRRGRRTRSIHSSARSAGSRSSLRRARRRPSSATPPRAASGRAASRRPSRSSGGTSSRAALPWRTSWTIFPGSASIDGSSSVGLQLGERRERVARELGPEQQRLQARDERVAAEHGHEPRHPGGRQLPTQPAFGCASAARRDRRPTGRTSAGAAPTRPQLRHAELPRGERVTHARALLAEAALDVGGTTASPSDTGTTSMRTLPALARVELDPEADAAAVDPPRSREDDLRPHRPVGILEHELVALGVEAPAAGVGQRLARASGRRARSRAP